MPPKELEGKTLGEKHRYYNKLVKDAITSDTILESGDFKSTNDVDNLIKIDIASNKRDVEYILNVLKCEDMLYISRAIKKCSWLITDRKHSHIINPEYLHTQLFPQMIFKASAKLMLHIRLNLKDEDRVEGFYNYIKDKDAKAALKWLPHCSLPFIQNEVENKHSDMSDHLLKRLFEISITILEIYIKKTDYYCKTDKLRLALFLINTNTEEYLNIIEPLDSYHIPNFGPKTTSVLMKKCPQRILDKFEKYANKIDLETFAKHLKKEEIKDFLTEKAGNKDLKSWFTFDNLKHFARHMPKEGKFEFLKKLFIEGKSNDENKDIVPYQSDECSMSCAMQLCSTSGIPSASSANIYRWYRFAPFDVAFPDLIKLIRAESAPTERIAIFGVLLSCAGRNPQHLHTLLQYYHDKHINEPFKFKIQFVNMILSKTNSHKFDELSWNLLNKIFYSMEVYTESENNVQSCIGAIIVYKILHNEPIPEIIENKFQFNSLKSIQSKLNKEENEIIFNYLYKLVATKLENKKIASESDLSEIIQSVEDIENLLIDWKRELVDYPMIIDKIKEIIKIKNENSWKPSLSSLYHIKKSWRKVLFEESMSMSPSDETCHNALKHDPDLLSRHKDEMEKILVNDSVFLRRSLVTLRVYWPQTLASEWSTSYLTRLDQAGGHKALTRGLCTLMSLNQVIDIVKKYAPPESKINWSVDDEHVLSLRKQLARNMYLSRPHPPLDVVMLYARGDYLQFALPSLNAVLHNMSSASSRQQITKLLDAPVSLQKHGIRLAFTKLDTAELKQVFHNIWNASKNSSIRAVLFEQTYNLLCREKNATMINEIWELLNIFIENISTEENKKIYELLGKVDNVPIGVRGKFIMKGFKFLKSLPSKANCESIINNIIYKMPSVMEHLDPGFVSELLMDSLDEKFSKQGYELKEIMATYLLCAKDVESQTERFNKILLPLLERSFARCKDYKKTDDKKEEVPKWIGENIRYLLEEISGQFQKFVFEKKMVFPSKLFTDILNLLEKSLPVEVNYTVLRYWKLTTTYVSLLEEHKALLSTINEEAKSLTTYGYYYARHENKWNEVYIKVIPDFSDICLQYLKEDIQKYFSSIYLLFGDALNRTFENIHPLVRVHLFKHILKDGEFIQSYLLVLENLPEHYYEKDEESEVAAEIRKMISSHPSTEIRIHYYRKYQDAVGWENAEVNVRC
uniref:Uncharacterized protein n=1 Tax=Pectinophora gossypiella TaxID=13191 RepID=A0A1E1WBR8_PECGO